MGDDLSLEERAAVRTPMQWANEQNGGFSTAPPDEVIHPVISSGEYGYERVNVTDQSRDRDSLLNRIEQLIRTRRACPELGWGDCRLLEVAESSVLVHCCDWRGGAVVGVHNLSEEPRTVTLDLAERRPCAIVDLISDQEYERVDGSECRVEIGGYGYRWLRLEGTRR